MEEVNCLFCNKKHQSFWIESGYTGRKCFQCGLIYLSPRPDSKEMQLLYNTGRAGGESAREQIAYNYGKDLMTKHILSIIKTFKTKGDFLEVGAGGGQCLLNARKEGFNPFAIEINKESAIYISKELGVKVENVSASDSRYFESQKFDVICHIDVLSHLHDPIGAFRISSNKLKKDGILVFETGNLAGVHRFWLNLIGRLGYPEHLYMCSIGSVKHLLRLSDFKLIAYHSYSIVLYQLISKILKIKEHKPEHSDTSDKNISFYQKLKHCIGYFLVYRLGTIFPKSWPATVIYIASKVETSKERLCL